MLTKPEVLERNDERGVWAVEQIDEPEGDCYVTIFHGPDSEGRARAYAEYLASQPAPQRAREPAQPTHGEGGSIGGNEM